MQVLRTSPCIPSSRGPVVDPTWLDLYPDDLGEVFSWLTVMTRSARSPSEVSPLPGAQPTTEQPSWKGAEWKQQNVKQMGCMWQVFKFFFKYIEIQSPWNMYTERKTQELDAVVYAMHKPCISQDKITSPLTWAKVASPELGYWQVRVTMLF